MGGDLVEETEIINEGDHVRLVGAEALLPHGNDRTKESKASVVDQSPDRLVTGSTGDSLIRPLSPPV